MTQILVKDLWIPERLSDWQTWNPKTELGKAIRKCFAYLPPELAAELVEKVSRVVVLQSQLRIRIFRQCPDCSRHPGPNHLGLYTACCRCPGWQRLIEDHGLVSEKVITTAGVNFLVDAWQNLVELENMKFHGIGTSTTAENSSQTALGAELTTQYNPDNTRATGSLAEGASANIFRTVGTNTVDAAVTVEEHGIFNQAATGGGTMWDRSLTGSKALSSGEGLESTYDMTASAGG